MQQPSWTYYYPWNPQKESYTNKTISKPNSNVHILDSVFSNILNSEAFFVESSILILFERSSFIKCTKGNSNNAVIYINLLDTGSCCFEKVIIESCQNKYESGNILYIIGNSNNAGTIKMKKTVSHNCQSTKHKNTDTTRNIVFDSNYQEVKYCNITLSCADSSLLSFNHALIAIVERCMLYSSSATARPFYMNYKAVIRKSNFVNNTEDAPLGDAYGLITTYDEGSIVIIEGCYIMKNSCQFLSITPSGTIIYIQCTIDDKRCNNNVQIKSPVDFDQLELSINNFEGYICSSKKEKYYFALLSFFKFFFI